MARDFGRYIPRTTQPAAATANVNGQSVRIHGDALDTWETLAANPNSGVADISTTLDIRAVRDSIGVEGIRQAAIDAGRRPPSDRTVRRWIAANRIPHAGVADRVQRRSLVERQGGVKALAAKVGLSPSAISRYQQGQTGRFRQQRHRRAADEVRVADALTRAGLADSRGNLVKDPHISVEAHFEYRNNGNTSSDYRTTRTFLIPDGPGAGIAIAPLDSLDAKDFAVAVARDDHAAAIAVIERHLTMNYAATFLDYDNGTGFHMEYVSDFTVDWR